MRKLFTCICGYQGNSMHTTKCSIYLSECQRITECVKKDAKEIYLNNYSAMETAAVLAKQENSLLPISKIRKIVEIFLKADGIYEGIHGVNAQRKKQEKIVKTSRIKYGVDNISHLGKSSFLRLNAIEYNKLSGRLGEEFTRYRKTVDNITSKNIKKMNIPEYCYYTGVKFVDASAIQVNPNDPLKRTIDHKIPVIIGYLKGISAEKIASCDNLAFVLRYVNTVKSNTTHDDFMPIAKYLREIFEKEGHEISNEFIKLSRSTT